MDLVSWTFANEPEDVDRPLLIDPSDPSRFLSFNGLRSCVKRLVAGLHALGVQPGDCVCVNSFNDIFYSALYFGIIGSGAIFTAVNPAYTANELIHHLKLTKPKLLIVEPQLLEPALAAASEVGINKSKIFAFDVHTDNNHADIRSWNDILVHGEEDWVRVADPSTTVAQYASTSGTSGLPKAALLSHNFHVSQASCRWTEGLPYANVRLTALPPFHVFATPIVPASIHQGYPTYVMRRFEMKSFIDHIEQYGITETWLPPPVLVGMPQSPHCSEHALQTLRQIWYGGASLKYSNQMPLYKYLHPDAKIQPVWGMTEAGWITAGVWPEKHTDSSVGRPLPGFHVKIVDDDDKTITDEEVSGNIFVKAPWPMLGYLDNEKATLETLPGEGWVRTGDVGQYAGGKVWVVDRKKDLIKVRGWQVSPAEVESIILQHPEVLDAAVIGVELENGTGEIPRAFVVLRPDTKLEPAELKAFVSQSLAKYKLPEEIIFVERIPKNGTGKILRRILREEASKGIKVEPAYQEHPNLSAASSPGLEPCSATASSESLTETPDFEYLRSGLMTPAVEAFNILEMVEAEDKG